MGTKKSTWISTFSGKQFDVFNPRVEDVDIEDIAMGLANTCRFRGFVKRWYSVAEHSILMYDLLPQDLRIYGLLHDAAEAYMGDLPKPIKRGLPLIDDIETGILRCVAQKFGLQLNPFFDGRLKRMDWELCVREAEILLPNKTVGWADVAEMKLGKIDLMGWDRIVAQEQFLDTFYGWVVERMDA